MPRRATRPELTPEQQAESDRILAALQQAAASDLRELADLLATKGDADTFGAAEFTARDIVLRVGARAIEAALEGRKKGGTTGPVGPAPAAPSPPGSSAGGPKRSWRCSGACGWSARTTTAGAAALGAARATPDWGRAVRT